MVQDVEYELWDRGYRINTDNFSSAQFRDILNKASQFNEGRAVNFGTAFSILRAAHPDWFINEAEEEDKYRLENEPKLRAYFIEHFFGKSWDEIDPKRWDYYSDWHKEVFGYRPHGIVCGVYISPHGNRGGVL